MSDVRVKFERYSMIKKRAGSTEAINPPVTTGELVHVPVMVASDAVGRPDLLMSVMNPNLRYVISILPRSPRSPRGNLWKTSLTPVSN
jgi:hypothetical protein